MRKTTMAIWSSILLTIVIVIGYIVYNNYSSYYDSWEENWGISLSKPNELNVVFESPPSFNGDGEGYYVLEYNEKQIQEIKDQAFWHPVNIQSIDLLNERLSSFREAVIANYPNKYEQSFHDNPIAYSKNDLYFYREKKDGSYCIALLNVEFKRLYLMEWTQ